MKLKPYIPRLRFVEKSATYRSIQSDIDLYTRHLRTKRDMPDVPQPEPKVCLSEETKKRIRFDFERTEA